MEEFIKNTDENHADLPKLKVALGVLLDVAGKV
jgi:hypothetical protein